MTNKKIILCMMCEANKEGDLCRSLGGKCEDHVDCVYKKSDIGLGIHTWNNFRMELIKKLIDLVPHVDELDKEYKGTLRFNFKSFRIKLKIEKGD